MRKQLDVFNPFGALGTFLGLGPRASCGPLQPGDDVPAGVNQGDPDDPSHWPATGTTAPPTVDVLAFGVLAFGVLAAHDQMP